VIHEVYNEIITKGLPSPLALAPLRSFIVILFRMFNECRYVVYYRLGRVILLDYFLDELVSSLIGNMFSKNVASLDSIIV
jgi:hypothetical protein